MGALSSETTICSDRRAANKQTIKNSCFNIQFLLEHGEFSKNLRRMSNDPYGASKIEIKKIDQIQGINNQI